MASVKQDIILYKNRYHVLEFTVDAASLAGCTAYWTASATPGSSPFVTKSSSGGTPKITINGLVVTVIIDEADFSAVTASLTYYHELVIVDASAKVNQAAVGEVELYDVTWTA